MADIKDNSFAQICGELTALHERKNHDYGNTFGNIFQELAGKDKKMAMTYAYGHMKEKVQRIHSVVFDGAFVKAESAEDSLYDLASYAIMTLAELHRSSKQE